ncbi:MAG TPA: hypothetical protein VIQ31_22345 [Phormidium sp.]
MVKRNKGNKVNNISPKSHLKTGPDNVLSAGVEDDDHTAKKTDDSSRRKRKQTQSSGDVMDVQEVIDDPIDKKQAKEKLCVISRRNIPNRGPNEDINHENESATSSDDDDTDKHFASKTTKKKQSTNKITEEIKERLKQCGDSVNESAMDDAVENITKASNVISKNINQDNESVGDDRETEEGLNMFIEDRPYAKLGSVLKNSVYAVVDERLFPTSKFYVDDEDVDAIVGFVMNNVGLHGRSAKHRQTRTKLWCPIRDYIKTRTNECRQLVYDRWYVVARSKYLKQHIVIMKTLFY